METQNWVTALFTYGPFALLVLFVFVIEERARKLVQGPIKKPIGAAVYALTWVSIFGLCVVVVVAWGWRNAPSEEYTIRGRLSGLAATNILSSPFEDLYLRRVYERRSQADFLWRIISPSPLVDNTRVQLYLERGTPDSEDVQIFELTVEPRFYKEDVSLVYDRLSRRLSIQTEEGQLNPLRQRSPELALSVLQRTPLAPASLARFLIPSVTAQTQPDLTEMATRLQADDPVVRLRARADLGAAGPPGLQFIDEVLSDGGSSYRLKLGAIVALNRMNPGSDALSTGARCGLIKAVGDPDPTLREQAATYIARLGPGSAVGCSATATTTPQTARPRGSLISSILYTRKDELFAVTHPALTQRKLFKARSGDVLSVSQTGLVLYRQTSGDLAVWNSTTHADIPIRLKATDRNFRFSPDGSRLAFVRAEERPVAGSLYLSANDGTNPTEALKGSWHDVAWSPDGNKLVTVGGDHFPWDIVIVDLASRSARKLWSPAVPKGTTVRPFDENGTGDRVAWSPDGKRVAFGLGGGIATVAVDGTDFRWVVRSGFVLPGYKSARAVLLTDFAPDGSHILFHTASGDIWLSGTDGSQPKKLAEGEVSAWGMLAPPK